MNSVLINGQPGDCLVVTDRAVHYGDGVFETIAVHNGVPRLWSRHFSRLQQGCERLGIPVPDRDLLRSEMAHVIRDEQQCIVKIIVTRGSGGRGYRSPSVVNPNRLVMCYPYPDYPASHGTQGIAVRICDTALGCNPRLAGIKHLNRLEQVLARNEWDDEAISEGLMLDGAGELVDGTMSNFFLVIDGSLYTPDLARCGVAGVMRAALIEIAHQQDIPLRIVPITRTLLDRAQELFVTNALIGLWPVNRCEERCFAIGPLTRRLQGLLAATLESSDA